MTDERRYQDDEIREIFGTAVEAPEHRPPAHAHGTGLTLAELQEIGREVGIPPERVSEAARALDHRSDLLPARKMLGVPVAVGRIVDLPRAPTDAEWDRLVSELRLTFEATGRAESQGDLRQWTNGNLHAFVEPGDDGYRLRLGTRKGDAPPRVVLGIGAIMLALVIAVIMVITEDATLQRIFIGPLVIGAFGAALLGSVLLGQPSWARLRERQMEHIADRARELITSGEG
jgi:uncharacterized integral membrane protein